MLLCFLKCYLEKPSNKCKQSKHVYWLLDLTLEMSDAHYFWTYPYTIVRVCVCINTISSSASLYRVLNYLACQSCSWDFHIPGTISFLCLYTLGLLLSGLSHPKGNVNQCYWLETKKVLRGQCHAIVQQTILAKPTMLGRGGQCQQEILSIFVSV